MNENTNLPAEQSREETVESTVFSNPAEHKQTKQKKKPLWVKALVGFLCVAVLGGGTFGIIKLIPKRNTEKDPGYAKGISLLSMDTNDVKEITFAGPSDTVTLYSEEDEPESSNTDVSYSWYVKGVDKDKVNITDTQSKAYNAVNLSASRQVTQKTAEECGLSKPSLTVTIVPRKEDPFVLTLGAASPDNTGYYATLSGKDGIYILPTNIQSELIFTALDMADADALPAVEKNDTTNGYFQNDSLSDFDKITVTGNNYPTPLVLINNKDKKFHTYQGYMTTSPAVRIADHTDGIMNIFASGLASTGAYSFDTSPEEQKKFGLHHPDFTARMDLGSYHLTYLFKLQDSGDYAVWSNIGSFIYKVSPDMLEDFIDLKAEDYYSGWICFYAIYDLNNFTVNTGGKTYSFDISTKETKSEDGESSEKEYQIVCNGKELVAMNFQRLYQYCIGLKSTDTQVSNLKGTPEMTMVYTFIDGHTSTVSFRKKDATSYEANVDGIPMGQVASDTIGKIAKYTEKCANGETINEII